MIRRTIIAVSAAAVVLSIGWFSLRDSQARTAVSPVKERTAPAYEAANLRVQSTLWKGSAEEVLDPTHSVWRSSPAVPVLLNRTPRIFKTDKIDQIPLPDLTVRCVRASNGTVIYLSWSDSTRDQVNVRKPSPAGTGARVRVIHSEATDRFADAAAVMLPVSRNLQANPSLQMGEKNVPVDIYFWHSTRGPAIMRAAGRAATERTGKKFTGKTAYSNGRWQMTFLLPKQPSPTPMAFAIWDGSRGQRGGLKFYSLWHTVR